MQIDWVVSLSQWTDRIAINDNGHKVSYRELVALIGDTQLNLTQTYAGSADTHFRPLVLLVIDNTLQSLVYYLTCLSAQWPVILVNPKLSEDGLNKIIEDFQPNLLLSDASSKLMCDVKHELAESLALILMTSGSTGGGKGVALSSKNINTNTQSICDYLPISHDDITLATMPFSYSYGLSVLQTHLAKGACVAMTSATVMDKAFWHLIETLPVTSLSGVPHWYDMLVRLRFNRKQLPHLRYFTQAGGKLSATTIKALAEFADTNKSQFFRMYGQTEATARMGWLSPQYAASKLDGIGRAIPGGLFYLVDEQGNEIHENYVEGELVYQGDNCMLGYVNNIADCTALSETKRLFTGDIALKDDDGDYRIRGRKKRIIKLLGERISLDGLETLFAEQGVEVKCCGNDAKLYVFCLTGHTEQVAQLAKEYLSFPPAFYELHSIAQWPLLTNGKTDYVNLMTQASSQ